MNVDVRGLMVNVPQTTAPTAVGLPIGAAPSRLLWRAFGLAKVPHGEETSCLACYLRWQDSREGHLRKQRCLDVRLGPQVLDCGADRG